MRAEIITTGTELLLGQIDDTNATYLARQLRDLGIDLFFRTTVGDNERRIAQALTQALARADLVLTTGGLGPTVDDVTRQAVARATGRPLVLHPNLLAQIEAFFARIGATMSDNNRRQAYLPEGCLPIENPVGTAPAFIVEEERGTIITLPGVPREMRYLMEHAVVPYLQERLGRRDFLVTRLLHTAAVGESRIDQALADLERSANPTVGLAAYPAQVDVRIVAKAPTPAEAERMAADMETQVRRRLREAVGDVVYGVDDETLESVIAARLRERGAKLAVAETITRGEVVRRLGDHPDVLGGGVVAADGPALAQLLGLEEPVPDGEEGAMAIAAHLGRVWGTDWALAVLEDREGSPWIALADEADIASRLLRFRGRGRRARTWTTTLALDFVRRRLRNPPLGRV